MTIHLLKSDEHAMLYIVAEFCIHVEKLKHGILEQMTTWVLIYHCCALTLCRFSSFCQLCWIFSFPTLVLLLTYFPSFVYISTYIF